MAVRSDSSHVSSRQVCSVRIWAMPYRGACTQGPQVVTLEAPEVGEPPDQPESCDSSPED